MTTFKINKHYEIACEWQKTRTAFRHVAILLKDGREIDRTKICYLNRTWESFEFESVINKLLDNTGVLADKARAKFLDKISGKVKEETDSQFKAISGIAKLGEILCNGDKKATNDWKARMIKSGLENKGLIIPEDWDTLDEETKESRLNNVLKVLDGNK